MMGVVLTALLIAIQPTAAFAKREAGGVVDPSTILGFGTRPSAMGNAFVALSDDATSVYWNPAALELNRRKELFGQYSQTFFDNSSYNMVAYKHPLGRFGTFGGGMIYEGVSDLTRRDVNANNVGSFNSSKMNVMFGYGKELTDGFSIGASLHVIRQQIAEFAGTGFGLDAGALYRFTTPYVEYSRAYLKLAREQLDAESESALRRDRTPGAAHGQTSAKKNLRRAVVEFMKTHNHTGDRNEKIREWFDEGLKLYDAGKLDEASVFFESVIRRARSNFVTDRLALGLNVQNLIEPTIKLKSVADKIPTNTKLGASYKLADWLQFAFDVDLPSKGVTRIHFGTEWRPVEWLALRAGLDHDEPAFGLGFRYQDLKIDYSFKPSNDLDNDFQRVSLSYEFGKSQADAATERIQRGLTLHSRKEFPAARREWENAEHLQPDNPLPRRYIQESDAAYRQKVLDPWNDASRYLAAGQLMEAESFLSSILAYDPAFDPAARAWKQMQGDIPAYVETHFKAGRLNFLQRDYESARQEMSRVLHFKPDHKPAEDYHDAASKRLEEQVRRNYVRDLYQQGMAEYRAGRWPEAMSRFQNVLRRDASHPTAGVLIDQISQLQMAALLPEEMQEESERFLKLAMAEFLDGNLDKAEILASTSLALWPENAVARYWLSRIAAGHNRELLDLLQKGDEFLSHGEVDRAVAAWQEVLEKDPGNNDARRSLENVIGDIQTFIETSIRAAMEFEKAGQIPQALGLYNRVLTVDPFHPTAGLRQAELRQQIASYLDADELQKLAMEKFDRSVTLARMQALYQEGITLFDARKFDEAVSLWQQVASKETRDLDAVPIQLAALRKIDEAIHEAERDLMNSAEKAVSKQIDDWLHEGVDGLTNGRLDGAELFFNAVLQVDPENSGALEGLNQVRTARERETVEVAGPKKYSPEVERLLAQADKWRQRAKIAKQQNRIDLAISRSKKALDLYKKILKTDPAQTDVRAAVSEIETDLRRLQRSWRAQRYAEIKKYVYAGLGHYHAGRLNEAVAEWDRALAIDPTYTQARELIKEAETKMEAKQK